MSSSRRSLRWTPARAIRRGLLLALVLGIFIPPSLDPYAPPVDVKAQFVGKGYSDATDKFGGGGNARASKGEPGLGGEPISGELLGPITGRGGFSGKDGEGGAPEMPAALVPAFLILSAGMAYMIRRQALPARV